MQAARERTARRLTIGAVLVVVAGMLVITVLKLKFPEFPTSVAVSLNVELMLIGFGFLAWYYHVKSSAPPVVPPPPMVNDGL
ncbi:hypothetical protein AMTR_s00002p00238790 [Amborella trichopoda]|uniref:Uncharacterized protein n=1 Tax=Amborella trichopoda TaxID=13333 RepID=W1P0S1_AMBTC|nr:hypothetical protein AMTR_s00002p00238790 [Amborella trichopoda]